MFIMIRDDNNDNWPKARSSDRRNDINNIESVTKHLTQSDREGDTDIDHEGDDNDKLLKAHYWLN